MGWVECEYLDMDWKLRDMELTAALVDGDMGSEQVLLTSRFSSKCQLVQNYFKRLLTCRKE